MSEAQVRAASGDEAASGGVDGERRTGRDLLRRALRTALQDPRVVLIGEGVGCHGVTDGLPAGPNLLRTPLSENGAVGLASGLALGGRRPVLEIIDPAGLMRAWEALDELANVRARSGGSFSAPVVILAPYADVRVPAGVHVAAASTPADLAGLLGHALAGEDPVVILVAGAALDEVGEASAVPTIGKAVVRRAGSSVTLLASGDGVALALEAAESEDVEVLDLRGIQPLDREAIGESVRRTGRAIAVGATEPLLAALNEAFLSLESPLVAVPATAGRDELVRAIRECVHY